MSRNMQAIDANLITFVTFVNRLIAAIG